MSARPPEFDELIGSDVPAAERDRLRRAHDLLVSAGPPPELSPSLENVPARITSNLRVLPRRRWRTLAVLAASIAGVAFFAGYLAGNHAGGSFVARGPAIAMHGTAVSPRSRASISLGNPDASGNWPMLVTIRGLAPLTHGDYYALYLSRHGRPTALCGSFTVHPGKTTFQLSEAYKLRNFDGWVVTRGDSKQVVLTT